MAPTLTESINSPAGTGWYNISTGPAIITYVASDATSGVTTPAPFTFSDGIGQSHAGITVTDVAGNTSAPTANISGIKQDTVAPTLTRVDQQPGRHRLVQHQPPDRRSSPTWPAMPPPA